MSLLAGSEFASEMIGLSAKIGSLLLVEIMTYRQQRVRLFEELQWKRVLKITTYNYSKKCFFTACLSEVCL